MAETIDVTFFAGETMACVDFTILPDDIQEGDEDFTVDFEIQEDLTFAVVEGDTFTATVTILDEDGNRMIYKHVEDITL